MWIFLPDSMLSIVQKPDDEANGTLTVRGLINGDIEAIFPDAVVTEGQGTDYRFRAKLPREAIAKALAEQVMDICYSNFKGVVKDRQRHDAFMDVWTVMHRYQEQVDKQ